MSAAILQHNATISNPLRDPSTSGEPVPPAFPLTQGNIHKIAKYSVTPFGQTSIISRVARTRGSHLCYVTTYSAVPEATWSSFQSSRSHHAELNSALVYMNHSCAPTVELVVHAPDADGSYANGVAAEVRVAQDRDLQIGDHLAFFYPSSEWATRQFQCLCGSEEKKCIGMLKGAKYLSKEVLDQYFINNHIQDLVAERDQK